MNLKLQPFVRLRVHDYTNTVISSYGQLTAEKFKVDHRSPHILFQTSIRKEKITLNQQSVNNTTCMQLRTKYHKVYNQLVISRACKFEETWTKTKVAICGVNLLLVYRYDFQ